MADFHTLTGRGLRSAMKPTRRQFAAIGVGTVLGTGAVVSIGSDTTAAEVTGTFTLPDVEKDIQNPVNSVQMEASGSISWDSETKPTRAILRLEVAKNSTDYEQVEAEAFSTGLERVQEQSFGFQGVNLLDHSEISAVDFSPTQTGETKQLSLHARLTLTVQHDGSALAEAELQETSQIAVTKTQGKTTVEMGATGEIEIGTSD